jgi:integrase
LKRSDSRKRRRVATGIYLEAGSYVAGYSDPATRNWTTKALPNVRTLTEAKRARRALLTDLEAGRIAAPQSLTMTTLSDGWLESRAGRLRSRTVETDGRAVAMIQRFFGDTKVQQVDGRMIERFLAALRDGKVGTSRKKLSEWTVCQSYKALRQMLDWAVANDVIVANPCARVQKHIRPRQMNRTQPRVLGPAELDALIVAAAKRCPSYVGVIATAAFTGARIREVLGLRWCDIDHDAKLITFALQIDVSGNRLVELKTEAALRANALVPKLEPYLGRQARMKARWSSDHDFVFSVRQGAPRDYANLRRALATAAKEAGLGHIRAHDLRHSATSILLQKADLGTVSKYVGHGNPAITAKVYSHAIGSPAEQAARVADAMRRADFGH